MRCLTGIVCLASDTLTWRPSAGRSTWPGTSNSVAYWVSNCATMRSASSDRAALAALCSGMAARLASARRRGGPPANRRPDHELPGRRIDDLRGARLTGGEPQRDAAPVLAGALHDGRLTLELHAGGRRVEGGAVHGLPARVRHLVGGAHLARARGRIADDQRARVAGAGAQSCEIALQRGDLLVDGALLDLDALDLSVGFAAAAPEGLDDCRDRLRVNGDRMAPCRLPAGPRAERSKVVAHQLGGLHLDVERRLLIVQRLDLRLEVGFAAAQRLGAAYVLHRNLADPDSGAGIYAQGAQVEVGRQAGHLQRAVASGDASGALDRCATRVQRDPADPSLTPVAARDRQKRRKRRRAMIPVRMRRAMVGLPSVPPLNAGRTETG